jgi:6-pyruvoyltetrahydropterin/6-carboxytetrahydropterin synthase
MSEVFQVVRSVEWDAGHRVPNHNSKCKNVHGHRYKLEVTVEGPLVLTDGASDQGMIIDFGAIKVHLATVAELFDHRFIMHWRDPLKLRLTAGLTFSSSGGSIAIGTNILGAVYTIPEFGAIQELDHVPTAENLAYLCYKLLSNLIDHKDSRVVMVRLWETPNCLAVYRPA